jgi:hypothetical protein
MRTHPALLILPVLGAGLLYEPPPLRAQIDIEDPRDVFGALDVAAHPVK